MKGSCSNNARKFRICIPPREEVVGEAEKEWHTPHKSSHTGKRSEKVKTYHHNHLKCYYCRH